MKKNGKWIAYAAYGIVVFILFLYLLFPGEKVREYLIYTAGEYFPDLKVDMETVRLAFPPGLNMKALTVQQNEQPLLQAPSARIRPALLSLFRPAKKLLYNVQAFSGNLKGESEFVLSGENEGFRIVTDIVDTRLEDMDFLRQSLATEIVGRLKGKVAFDRKAGQMEAMTARIDVTDCAFDAVLPMINIGRLEFGHVALDLSLANRQIQINQLDFNGNQADGKITGFVRVRTPLAQSVLSLKGTFTPHPEFIAELSKKFPVQALFKSRNDRDGIGFSIRGTIARPDFNFSRG